MAGTEGIEGIEGTQSQAKPLWRGLARVGVQPNLRLFLLLSAGGMMLADLYLIFMVAPTDSVLGHVQRIIYVHVPVSIMSFLAFLIVFLGSLAYVFRREAKWDGIARAAAEVGLVFISLALITGMIWAKPVWNAWWLWTPRLTTTLILWLIFVAYLMVRSYAPNRDKAALYGAVMGIIGFADVVVVYFSVEWWPGIHPTPVIGPLAESGALHPTMRSVLIFSFVTFFALLLYLIAERAAIQETQERIRGMRFSLRRSRAENLTRE